MKTFAFILYVMNPLGAESAFVIDHNLTMQDCAQLAIQWTPTLDQFSRVACQ